MKANIYNTTVFNLVLNNVQFKFVCNEYSNVSGLATKCKIYRNNILWSSEAGRVSSVCRYDGIIIAAICKAKKKLIDLLKESFKEQTNYKILNTPKRKQEFKLYCNDDLMHSELTTLYLLFSNKNSMYLVERYTDVKKNYKEVELQPKQNF